MKRVDFHGLVREDLELEVDRIIGMVRVCGITENYEFITGEGVLKEHLKNYLKEEYGLDYREDHNCSGTITVTVE